MSKLGLCSRREAIALVLDGRVRVDGRRVTDPGHPVIPERARIAVDGAAAPRARWTTLALHKPRGVVTTRRDPRGRPTVYDLIGEVGTYVAPVGRLDQATSGLLLLTNDTRLGDWLLDPAHAIPRTYLVTARGRVDPAALDAITGGVMDRGELLRAAGARLRKASGRESHLVLTLTEGKNREVRRLLAAAGHEVTALTRVAFGGIDLGRLPPGEWRELSRATVREAFPGAPIRDPKAEG
jgi:23S rRNA pseudouridine2605 synthase